MRIRRYQRSDHDSLYEICLRTGDRGDDATQQYTDPWLLGRVYLGAYLALAPELAFVLDDGTGTPAGYALGTADTVAFAAACEQSWWPPLRRRYPRPTVPPERGTPDQRLVHLIHQPPSTPSWITDRYPAHLHIDLLPAAQGRGLGRALMTQLLDLLATAGATGVHLGVALDNHRAIGFYRRLGFQELAAGSFGRTLPAEAGR